MSFGQLLLPFDLCLLDDYFWVHAAVYLSFIHLLLNHWLILLSCSV